MTVCPECETGRVTELAIIDYAAHGTQPAERHILYLCEACGHRWQTGEAGGAVTVTDARVRQPAPTVQLTGAAMRLLPLRVTGRPCGIGRHDGHRIQESRTIGSITVRRTCTQCDVELAPYEERAETRIQER